METKNKASMTLALCWWTQGIRTLDLSDANRTLSQLSYGPVYEVFGDVNCLPATGVGLPEKRCYNRTASLPN